MPTKSEYHQYLASREWAIKREAVKRRAEGLCERCWALPMTAVHHKTYEHVGHEPLEDLQAICGPCHRFESGKATIDPLDVASWVFSLDFALFRADGPFGDDDSRLAEYARSEAKYGPGWEAKFLTFVLEWPSLAGITPIADRIAGD